MVDCRRGSASRLLGDRWLSGQRGCGRTYAVIARRLCQRINKFRNHRARVHAKGICSRCRAGGQSRTSAASSHSVIHANNYSMDVRSDPFESAKSHLFDTASRGPFCDVTLTLKQARQRERGAWIKIDDYACRQAFRHFSTGLLNRTVYGAAFRRYGKSLRVLPVLEKGEVRASALRSCERGTSGRDSAEGCPLWARSRSSDQRFALGRPPVIRLLLIIQVPDASNKGR